MVYAHNLYTASFEPVRNYNYAIFYNNIAKFLNKMILLWLLNCTLIVYLNILLHI